MRIIKRSLSALFCLAGLVHCGVGDHEETLGQQTLAWSCGGAWTPTWEEQTANPWWVEYAISGDVVAAHLEIIGRGSVPLSFRWNKWIGKSHETISPGTIVVVHAVHASGERAKTRPFGFLIDPRPTTEPCAPAACDHAFHPKWEQRTANPWWVEYAISGDVVAAHLEVIGRGSVPLSFQWNKWIGKSLETIPAGTPVVVHAESSSGQRAKTRPFAYLKNERPKTAPCESTCTPSCEGRSCGDDGCGGSCGTCEAPASCTHDGKELAAGQTVDAGDGCNTCTCGVGGAVTCTDKTCKPCDPVAETHRTYIATPEQCAVIRYTCPAGQFLFSNSCGCGCETPI